MVDDAARIIMDLGPGSLLAKIDIAHAFCNVPVHPADRHLLGLPFGLRSSPKIFSAISDTLELILLHHGMSSCLYCIDDFITMGTAGSEECSQNLKLMFQVCKQVGLPIAPNKVEGPTAVLEFLCIEFNTEHMTMHLPSRKLTCLKVVLRQWLGKKAVTE